MNNCAWIGPRVNISAPRIRVRTIFFPFRSKAYRQCMESHPFPSRGNFSSFFRHIYGWAALRIHSGQSAWMVCFFSSTHFLFSFLSVEGARSTSLETYELKRPCVQVRARAHVFCVKLAKRKHAVDELSFSLPFSFHLFCAVSRIITETKVLGKRNTRFWSSDYARIKRR